MSVILVVDDDTEIRDVIHVYLRNEGHSVLEASDGVDALDVLKQREVDLIILDVMMPRMDGIKACMRIRERSSVPIIMLSAKEGDMDKIMGLTTGADDYVTKPFNPMELIARVKAQLRRQRMLAAKDAAHDQIAIRELVIDMAKHFVSIRGQPVMLTPLEFAILRLLAASPGHVFSADAIYESVWKERVGYSDNTVMVHIRNLREKLELNPRKPEYIKTVWGVGYKMDN
ncbi:response regulator transcription factor [Cohnella thailandensis]|uniref:Response regulator transcription factor n=1 Tax=Cohnella thailandensis TaxID=557557 RepID=A0A841SU37_9BACL|nr:response regulator transcription factor [Cohnella thailandensis]MBB6633410.1 response regulator transcription factor [Cohnella thailandensis]MBP1977247.1 DNA-binding response OmpR family regulator [Cohnella thailandensis]